MVATESVACCAPLLQVGMTGRDAIQAADRLKVLADPARLRLLNLIAAAPEDGACVCELIAPLDLSQPTVSHHLKVLRDAGFVTREKRGTWAYYRLVPESLDQIITLLAPPGSPAKVARKRAS